MAITARINAIPTTSNTPTPHARVNALGYAPGPTTLVKRGVLNRAENARLKCRSPWHVGIKTGSRGMSRPVSTRSRAEYISSHSWKLDHPESIACSEVVEKQLPSCEHKARMKCSVDPAQVPCKASCNGYLQCCDKQCQSECGRCQDHNPGGQGVGTGITTRTKHAHHPCTKPLYCQHLCGGDCSKGHDCSNVTCQKPCRQKCQHHRCKLWCSVPCAPCMEPCEWSCDHHACPVSCGAVSWLFCILVKFFAEEYRLS